MEITAGKGPGTHVLARVLPLALCAAAATAGCAHVHVDAQGNRHVLGLVMLTLPAPAGAVGADSMRARSVGLSLTSTPIGSSLVLGYSDSALVAVKNNSLVPLADTAAGPGR